VRPASAVKSILSVLCLLAVMVCILAKDSVTFRLTRIPRPHASRDFAELDAHKLTISARKIELVFFYRRSR
jgi:hypothetical protein